MHAHTSMSHIRKLIFPIGCEILGAPIRCFQFRASTVREGEMEREAVFVIPEPETEGAAAILTGLMDIST